MTFLFAVCEPRVMTILLYYPVDAGFSRAVDKFVNSFDVLLLVKSMIRSRSSERPPLDRIKTAISNLQWGGFRIMIEDLLELFEDPEELDIPALAELGLETIYNNIRVGLTPAKSILLKKRRASIYTSIPWLENKPFSRLLHDQGNAWSCWAFAIASSIRGSLRQLLRKVEDRIDARVKEAWEYILDLGFRNILIFTFVEKRPITYNSL
jgi:hypothetical protein